MEMDIYLARAFDGLTVEEAASLPEVVIRGPRRMKERCLQSVYQKAGLLRPARALRRRAVLRTALLALLIVALLAGAVLATNARHIFIPNFGVLEPETDIIYVADSYPEKTVKNANGTELLWRLKSCVVNGDTVIIVTAFAKADGSLLFENSGGAGSKGDENGAITLRIDGAEYKTESYDGISTRISNSTTYIFNIPAGTIKANSRLSLEQSVFGAALEFGIVKSSEFTGLADVGVYAANDYFEMAVVPTLNDGVLTASLYGINHSPYEFVSFGFGGWSCGLEDLIVGKNVRLVSSSGEVVEADEDSRHAVLWSVPSELCYDVEEGESYTLEVPAVAVAGDGFSINETFNSIDEIKNYTKDVVLSACKLHFYTEQDEAGSWRMRCTLKRTSKVFRAVGATYVDKEGSFVHYSRPHLLDMTIKDNGEDECNARFGSGKLEENMGFELNVKEMRYALMTNFSFDLSGAGREAS